MERGCSGESVGAAGATTTATVATGPTAVPVAHESDGSGGNGNGNGENMHMRGSCAPEGVTPSAGNECAPAQDIDNEQQQQQPAGQPVVGLPR